MNLYNFLPKMIGSVHQQYIVPDIAYEAAQELYSIEGKLDPRLERAIARDAVLSYSYAVHVLDGRFKLGEPVMLTNAWWALRYAEDIIGGRWPEAEAAISTDGYASMRYAVDTLKGRFEQGENAIDRDNWWDRYQSSLRREYGIEL